MAQVLLDNTLDVECSTPGFLMSGEIRAMWRHVTQLAGHDHIASSIKFDLMDVHLLAPDTIICDVDTLTCRHRLRFVGTRYAAVLGEDPTGWYIDEVNLGPYRSQQLSAFNQAVATGLPQWNCVRVVGRDDYASDCKTRSGVSYERLIVPLAGINKPVERLVAITRIDEIMSDRNTFEHEEIVPNMTYFHA
ncbi:MAG: hypothetical protein RH946_11390 [Rhodospirillales bacterium]